MNTFWEKICWKNVIESKEAIKKSIHDYSFISANIRENVGDRRFSFKT